jgi:CDP-paratose 2-epimerase
LERLIRDVPSFEHHGIDIRDRDAIARLFQEVRPDLIFHCAAQPSHDLAASRPFDDFEINAVATLNLLEATRVSCPGSPFVFMSTNKVYGDAPNELSFVELESRWDYANARDREGISENCRIDKTTHSLFGVSKAAADLLVQEYGRYYDMPTVCFRGGCLTGPKHSGAELHGFLAYLAKAVVEQRTYRIFGYLGKQVRDNIHSHDVCTAMLAYAEAPKPGAVYNLGGGRANSLSLLEAKDALERITGKQLNTMYVESPRRGDHICYISDMSRFRRDYPRWEVTVRLDQMLDQLAEAALARERDAR